MDRFVKPLAIRIESELGMALDIASMGGGQELLDPLGRPFDRALQLPRGEGGDDILGMDAGLHAEAAADIAHDDAHLFLLEAEKVAEGIARA